MFVCVTETIPTFCCCWREVMPEYLCVCGEYSDKTFPLTDPSEQVRRRPFVGIVHKLFLVIPLDKTYTQVMRVDFLSE